MSLTDFQKSIASDSALPFYKSGKSHFFHKEPDVKFI